MNHSGVRPPVRVGWPGKRVTLSPSDRAAASFT